MLSIDVTSKIALVIGGSRGIGSGITRSLCESGATVVFTHTGRPELAADIASLIDKLQQTGGQAFAKVSDACNSTETDQLVKTIVDELGRIDILVCNAGRTFPQPVEQTTDQQWEDSIRLNLTSAFNAVRAVLPGMIETGDGRIVLIGSSAVFDGGGGSGDYAAAKAGLVGLMRYLNRSYAHKGIRTNIVHPCVIDTELLRTRYDTPAKRQALIDQIPAGRLGQPHDIGQAVTFLASDNSSFIYGQEILVSGGRR